MLLAPLAAFFVSLGLVVAKILLADGAAASALARRPAAAAAARREPKLPFGIDPPGPGRRAEAARRARKARAAQPGPDGGDFVDRLADTSGGESLPLIVAGDGRDGALPAALVAARRLTRRGPTALVDLGPSPSWLPDLFDRERDGGAVRTGLSDLVADVGALARAVHRDLSTPLDIFPPATGAVAPDDLPAALELLALHYDFVVVHAADWASPAVAAPRRRHGGADAGRAAGGNRRHRGAPAPP